MARGLRRGPNLLRFRSLVDSIAEYVTGILDARQPSKVRYALHDCYLMSVPAVWWWKEAEIPALL